jgi:hypothetical protein
MPTLNKQTATPEVKPFAITVRLDSEIAQSVYELSTALRISRTDAIRILIDQGRRAVASGNLGNGLISNPAPARS